MQSAFPCPLRYLKPLLSLISREASGDRLRAGRRKMRRILFRPRCAFAKAEKRIPHPGWRGQKKAFPSRGCGTAFYGQRILRMGRPSRYASGLQRPDDEELPPDEPGDVELPLDEPGEVELPPDEPGDVELPPDEPGDVELPPDEPDDEELPPDEPGDMELPPDEPGDVELPPDEPGDVELPFPGRVSGLLGAMGPGGVVVGVGVVGVVPDGGTSAGVPGVRVVESEGVVGVCLDVAFRSQAASKPPTAIKTASWRRDFEFMLDSPWLRRCAADAAVMVSSGPLHNITMARRLSACIRRARCRPPPAPQGAARRPSCRCIPQV